uniref:Uncharacterized LOC105924804 n=1 Tax=Fundulus heteroclitus TaxID=8078 RepID=A0A3Q2PVZ5_FUNHE
MAAPNYMWIASLVFLLTSDAGVLGRAVDSFGVRSQSPQSADGSSRHVLRADGVRRWRRGAAAGAHRERCAELVAPWQENKLQAPEHGTAVLQLRVRPYSPGATRGLVFPGKSLFSFIRRVYLCCQERLGCRSVKGIQGRLRGGKNPRKRVEFVLTREVLSMTVWRAELHLQLSNPQHLDINPIIPFMVKYSLVSRGDAVELKVDLLLLFQHLQEAACDAGRGGNPSLGILQDADGEAGSGVPCGSGGVHLSHAPFMALYYR